MSLYRKLFKQLQFFCSNLPCSEMLAGQDSNYWNKKSLNNNFFITTSSSLENYFKNHYQRINQSGYFPSAIPFTKISENQSLNMILLKKTRGIPLSHQNQVALAKQILFVNRSSYENYYISIGKVFDFYLEYKKNQFFNRHSDKIVQQLVKPFIIIYMQFVQKEYQIFCTSNHVIRKELKRLFKQIEEEKQLFKLSLSQFQQQQPAYNGPQMSQINKIILEADRMIERVGENEHISVINVADEKFKIRDLIRSSLKTIRSENRRKTERAAQNLVHSIVGTPRQIQKEQLSHKQIIRNNTQKDINAKTKKKIKFKDVQSNDISNQQDGNEANLCYQLGLLISDTDRILRPQEEQLCQQNQ